MLDNKICVVTGASRGVGRGVALALGGFGATVYVTGRSSKWTSPSSVDKSGPHAEARSKATLLFTNLVSF